MNRSQQLHEQTITVAKTYKQCEAQLIELLMQNDSTRAYLGLGYPSLHVYCTKALGLSDAIAYSLSQIARKSRAVPEIKNLIKEDKLTITNATQLVRVITNDNKTELLGMAQTLSKRDLEKEIKRLHPEVIPHEKIRVLNEELEELKVVMDSELSENLKYLKGHYSRKSNSNLSLAETLKAMANELRAKHDPVKKAERCFVPGSKVGQVLQNHVANTDNSVRFTITKRRALSAKVKHPVNLRDQGRCTFRYIDGSRCENTRYLQMHHLKHVASGGTDTLENIKNTLHQSP